MQVVVYGYLPGYEIFIDLQFIIEHYMDMMIKTSAKNIDKKSMEAGVISAISVINRNKILRRNIPGLGVIYRQRYV